MRRIIFLATTFIVAVASTLAVAQTIPGCPSPASPGCVAIQQFVAGGSASLAVTSTTARAALGTSGPLLAAVVSNTGAVDAWVSAGGSSITATANTGVLVPAGGWAVIAPLGSATYLAGITASSTTSLRILTGTGVPTASPVPPAAAAAVGVTPRAGTLSAIAVGGTSVTVITGPIAGGFIINPYNAAAQKIATAENAYLSMVGAPGGTDAAGNGATVLLIPGQSFTLPPLAAGIVVKLNAATTSHAFTINVW